MIDGVIFVSHSRYCHISPKTSLTLRDLQDLNLQVRCDGNDCERKLGLCASCNEMVAFNLKTRRHLVSSVHRRRSSCHVMSDLHRGRKFGGLEMVLLAKLTSETVICLLHHLLLVGLQSCQTYSIDAPGYGGPASDAALIIR